jgi:L-seryl-tRNA(Ser) seleniumtransferase
MIRMAADEVESRARRLMQALPSGSSLEWDIVAGESVIGGGSAPGYSIPTRLIALHHASRSAAALEKILLAHQPPVIARVEEGRVLLDLRTILPGQEEALFSALQSLA